MYRYAFSIKFLSWIQKKNQPIDLFYIITAIHKLSIETNKNQYVQTQAKSTEFCQVISDGTMFAPLPLYNSTRGVQLSNRESEYKKLKWLVFIFWAGLSRYSPNVKLMPSGCVLFISLS